MLTFLVLAVLATLWIAAPRMSAGIPPVTVAPRRAVSPQGIWLEGITQPLYSCFALNNAALPVDAVRFFGYGIGTNVPGAGNFAGVPAGIWHTNLEIPNQLAKPKVFTCFGLGLVLPTIASTAGANAPEMSDSSGGATANQDSDMLEDLKAITYTGHFRFRVGEKNYAFGPAFLYPGNLGFGGIVDASEDSGVAAAEVESIDLTLPMSVGVGATWHTYPVKLDEAQTFEAAMRFPWGTNIPLNDDRALFCVLFGKLSREVQ